MSLSTLMFSEYRRRVLGLLLLHPQDSYHLRELARLTATQPGTLRRELSKLSDAGLLLKENIGNQIHYRANRECPIFEELASILRKTSGLGEVLAEALLPLAEQITQAFVFGSMASGKESANSDIDLMLVGELSFSDALTALYPLQDRLGREINPKVYREQEWKDLLMEQGAFIRDVMAKPRLFIIGSDAETSQIGGLS